MHELAICEAIAGAVRDHADDATVDRVLVRIGHLRQVVPGALTFSWDLVVAGTPLDGSVLEVEHVPATVACGACAGITTLDAPLLLCGGCGSSDVRVLTGDEMSIVGYERATATRGAH